MLLLLTDVPAVPVPDSGVTASQVLGVSVTIVATILWLAAVVAITTKTDDFGRSLLASLGLFAVVVLGLGHMWSSIPTIRDRSAAAFESAYGVTLLRDAREQMPALPRESGSAVDVNVLDGGEIRSCTVVAAEGAWRTLCTVPGSDGREPLSPVEQG